MMECMTKMGQDGRIVLPAKCRKALALEPGEKIVIYVDAHEARLLSLRQVVRKAQQQVKKYNKADKSLVDALLQERRDEVEHE